MKCSSAGTLVWEGTQGGNQMDFYTLLDQVIDLLRQRQRVSYRALKRQFQLDDDYLEDLKVELIRVQQLAVDQEGEMLVWTGDTGSTAPPACHVGGLPDSGCDLTSCPSHA